MDVFGDRWQDYMTKIKKNWNAVVDFTRKVGYQKVSGKLYKDMRHEIHNDLCKDEVFADVLRFIN